MHWAVFVETKMRARLVIVVEVIPQHLSQMVFIEDDHVVESFPSNGADDSLHKRILPRGPPRDPHLLDTEVVCGTLELCSVDAVSITKRYPTGTPGSAVAQSILQMASRSR